MNNQYGIKVKSKSFTWFMCIDVVIIVSMLLTMGFLLYKTNKTDYDKFLNTMPSENYIEEDLEDKLLSRNIDILDSKKENDQIFYTVSIKYVHKTIPIQQHYLVLYEATSECVWVYKSHRLLAEYK